jgi:hypothetical protein
MSPAAGAELYFDRGASARGFASSGKAEFAASDSVTIGENGGGLFDVVELAGSLGVDRAGPSSEGVGFVV